MAGNPNKDSKEKLNLSGGKESGISLLKKAADKLKQNSNLKHNEKLLTLSSSIEPMKQIDEISYMQSKLISILAKVKKENPELKLEKLRPSQLSRMIAVSKISLDISERIALETFERVVQESGATSDYLLKAWPDVVNQANTASQGWSTRLKESFQKDPIKTGALLAAGAAGVWIGYKMLKGVIGWFKKDKTGTTPTSKEGSSSWGKKLLIALGIMGAGSIIGKEKLKQLLGLMGMDDIKKVLEKGGAIPEKLRKAIEAQSKKIEALNKKIAAAKVAKDKVFDSAKGVKETVKKVADKETREAFHLYTVSRALVNLYCMDPEKFPVTFKNKIGTAMGMIQGKTIHEIVSAYKRHKSEGRIPPSTLGISIKGIDEKALFYATEIIAKTNQKLGKKVSSQATLKQYLLEVHKDPAISISSNVQQSVVSAFASMGVTSLADIPKNLNKVLKDRAIDKAIDKNRDGYFQRLAEKYGVTENLNPIEKKKLWVLIGFMYRDTNLSDSPAVIRQKLKLNTSNEKLVQAGLAFAETLKVKTKEALRLSISKYDIKRRNKPKFDQILRVHLKSENLTFKDGLQLSLLAESIKPGASDSSGAENAKGLTMVYLILKILKRNDINAHKRYLANIIALSTEGSADIDINVNFKPLVPYLNTIGAIAIKRAKRELIGLGTLHEGLVGDKHSIEQIRGMSNFEFGAAALKKGTMGAIQIPKELVLTLTENFGSLFEKNTNSSTIIKMIMALGGTLGYSRHEGKNLGWIYLGGKYFFWKPIEITKDSLIAMLKDGPFSGTPYKTYLMGAAPFIVFGAAAGGLSAANQGIVKGGIGMMRGAMRGVAAPATLPIAGYRATRGVLRWSQLKLWNYAKYGRGSLASLEQSTKLFLKYNALAPSAHGGDLIDRAKALKKERFRQVRRLMYAELYENARLRWAKQFTGMYNRFFSFNPSLSIEGSTEGFSLKAGDSPKAMVIEAERMGEFIKRLRKQMPQLEKMSRAEFISELEKFKSQTFKNNAILKDVEFEALRDRRLHNDAEFKKFKRALGKEVPGTGRLSRTAQKMAGVLGAKKTLDPFLKIDKNTYRFMGEEFKLDENKVKTLRRLGGDDPEGAIKKYIQKEWNRPRVIKEGNGFKVFRYRGGEFSLPEAEYKGKSQSQLKNMFEAKFLETIKITNARTVNGVKQFKIGKEWVSMADDPKSLSNVKRQYLEQLKKAGKSMDIKSMQHSKLLRYFPVFQKVMGPSMAALMIYHLETAQDKRQALAETTLGFGSFMAGMKSTEMTVGRFVKHPVGKFVINVMGGVLATMGLWGTIQGIIKDYWPKFAGSQHISLEFISLLEKATGRSVTRTALRSMAKGIGKKGLEKLGMKGVTTALNKKIKSTVLKRIHRFASKGLGRKIAISLGARGAVLAATIANDATVIGVLDDVVAVGMAIWMAKDVYDIVSLSLKASKIKDAMEKRTKLPISNIQPKTEVDQKALEAAAAVRGKKVNQLSSKELMDILPTIPDISLRLTRSGASGYEEYRFVKGEVWSTTIQTDSGEVLELTDDELTKEIKLPPPKEFKMWEIDYKAPKEKLLSHYRMAILYSKSQAGWTKLDFDIVDDKTINVKRLDSDEALTIRRSGSTWSVESYKSGLNLFQAIALANLTGKIKGIIRKENHEAGSSRPFEKDGDDIDFDKKSGFDLTVMSGSTGWLGFYKKIGLKQTHVIEALNNWYSRS